MGGGGGAPGRGAEGGICGGAGEGEGWGGEVGTRKRRAQSAGSAEKEGGGRTGAGRRRCKVRTRTDGTPRAGARGRASTRGAGGGQGAQGAGGRRSRQGAVILRTNVSRETFSASLREGARRLATGERNRKGRGGVRRTTNAKRRGGKKTRHESSVGRLLFRICFT